MNPGLLPNWRIAYRESRNTISEHMHSSLSRCGMGIGSAVDGIGETIEAGTGMRTVGQPDILGQAVPVANLAAGMGVGVGIAHAPRERVAIEILELRRQLPDDP